MDMAAKILSPLMNTEGTLQGCAHIGVHEESGSQFAVEFNVIGLAVHGVGQGLPLVPAGEWYPTEHEGVKAWSRPQTMESGSISSPI